MKDKDMTELLALRSENKSLQTLVRLQKDVMIKRIGDYQSTLNAAVKVVDSCKLEAMVLIGNVHNYDPTTQKLTNSFYRILGVSDPLLRDLRWSRGDMVGAFYPNFVAVENKSKVIAIMSKLGNKGITMPLERARGKPVTRLVTPTYIPYFYAPPNNPKALQKYAITIASIGHPVHGAESLQRVIEAYEAQKESEQTIQRNNEAIKRADEEIQRIRKANSSVASP